MQQEGREIPRLDRECALNGLKRGIRVPAGPLQPGKLEMKEAIPRRTLHGLEQQTLSVPQISCHCSAVRLRNIVGSVHRQIK